MVGNICLPYIGIPCILLGNAGTGKTWTLKQILTRLHSGGSKAGSKVLMCSSTGITCLPFLKVIETKYIVHYK
jgi:Cdc6-like AAA superfamily ATPase